MEKEREIVRLVNVLHRIARGAYGYEAWKDSRQEEATRFCVTQYNKVRARLCELEASITQLFTPLSEDASPEVIRMAAHELAAYFEEEIPRRKHRRPFRRCGVRFGWSPVHGRYC